MERITKDFFNSYNRTQITEFHPNAEFFVTKKFLVLIEPENGFTCWIYPKYPVLGVSPVSAIIKSEDRESLLIAAESFCEGSHPEWRTASMIGWALASAAILALVIIALR